MPTYEAWSRFLRDFEKLTPENRAACLQAVRYVVADLQRRSFRAGLRVKKMAGRDEVWEMTWAANGRATFHYGDEKIPGQPHIVWRRIGGHDIFKQP